MLAVLEVEFTFLHFVGLWQVNAYIYVTFYILCANVYVLKGCFFKLCLYIKKYKCRFFIIIYTVYIYICIYIYIYIYGNAEFLLVRELLSFNFLNLPNQIVESVCFDSKN